MRTTRGEARRLRVAAEERRRLILSLHREIDRRRALLRQHGVDCADGPPPRPDGLVAHDAAADGPAPRRRFPAWLEPAYDLCEALLTDFFRQPTAQRQAQRRRDVGDVIVLRHVCEERLAEIHRLSAEAERYAALMRSMLPSAGSDQRPG